MSAKIRVLVIDDSAVFRELLVKELESEGTIEVMGRAPDPIIAKKLLATARPDVITLDVEMPRQDGLSFLEELMRETPLPVVMVSSLTDAGCEATLRAFELGAVDAICKPADGDRAELGRRVREAVVAAAHARPRATTRLSSSARIRAVSEAETMLEPAPAQVEGKVVAIGASTGGTEALKEVLRALPRRFPPLLIVQHMPDAFTAGFARSLSSVGNLEVREATAEDIELRPGVVVLARGGLHLLLAREGTRLVAQLRDGPAVRNHKPSVDVLFTSVAKTMGPRAFGVILTGMGDDGARGLLKIREAGGRTLAQDEATSVVYGMPKRAAELGAVEASHPLGAIGRELVRLITAR